MNPSFSAIAYWPAGAQMGLLPQFSVQFPVEPIQQAQIGLMGEI